jgi:energy-coupling factor transporter ATP-binding protein EcfA2
VARSHPPAGSALPEPAATSVPRIEWDAFLAEHFTWRQGEHVTLIGPTGAGKTTLALALLPLRDYVIAFGTKPQDKTLDSLVKHDGWKLVRTWDAMPNAVRTTLRVVFWPRFKTPADQPAQAYEIGQAMNNAFTQGSWCLFVDELWYMDHVLGLKRMIEALWTQGRSIGLSIVAGTQRPAHVSLLAYDQATHVFFWRDNDERNLKRISGMNGLNARLIRETVSGLDRHAVLYVNTRTGAMVVTKSPPRK